MQQLRTNVASLFRQYKDVQSPEVIDLLVYKGREELEVRADWGRVGRPRLCCCGQRPHGNRQGRRHQSGSDTTSAFLALLWHCTSAALPSCNAADISSKLACCTLTGYNKNSALSCCPCPFFVCR